MTNRATSSFVAVMQSMAGRVLFVLINAGTGIITARALHPAGRGELAALGVWPNFLGSAMTFGLPSALVFWSRSNPERKSTLLWASLPLTFVMGLVATLIGVVGIPYWLSQYSTHIVHLAQLFMINAMVVLLVANARAACEAEGDFLASSIALCLTPLLTLFSLLALLLARSITPASAALAYIAGGLPSCVFLFARLRRHFRQPPAAIGDAMRKLLNYGARSYGVDLCGTLSLYADQAVVVHILDPAAMGTYVVALSLSRTLNVIHQAVAAVLFPKAVSLEGKELIGVTGRATRASTLCTAAAGLLVAVCGPVLLSLLYGREYRDATLILNILIAEVILTGLTLVLTRAFMAMGRPGVVTVLQSSGPLMSLPLLALFVPRWGALGASIALLTAAAVRLAFALLSFRIVLGHPAPNVIPTLNDARAVIPRVKAAVVAGFRTAGVRAAGA